MCGAWRLQVHHSHVVVDGQLFSEVYMAEFLQHMTEACGWSWDDALIADQGPARQLPVFQFDQKLPLQCARKKAITTERALEMIAHYLRPNDVVYPDVTSALACSQVRPAVLRPAPPTSLPSPAAIA